MSEDDLLARLKPEERARLRIDQMLDCGWKVRYAKDANVHAGRGVAIREFVLAPGHVRVDYLCYVDGTIEATRMTRAVLTEHIVKLAYPDTSVHLP